MTQTQEATLAELDPFDDVRPETAPRTDLHDPRGDADPVIFSSAI